MPIVNSTPESAFSNISRKTAFPNSTSFSRTPDGKLMLMCMANKNKPCNPENITDSLQVFDETTNTAGVYNARTKELVGGKAPTICSECPLSRK